MKHAQHKPTSSATASHEAQPAKPAHRPGRLSATPAWAQGRPPALQAQLTINQPGDRYEQEANRVADTVMRMPEPGVQRKCAACEEESHVQRQHVEEEEEELQMKEAAPAPAPATAPPAVQSALSAPGRPLDAGTRSYMEPRFGADFSDVRVHTDGQAAESAQTINARAYTVGRDVVFGAGQYAPGTGAGKQLIAHELAHVVQQGGGPGSHVQRQGGGPAPLPRVTNVNFVNAGAPHGDNCCDVCGGMSLGVGQGGTGSNGMEMQFTISGHRSGVAYDILRTRRNSLWEQVGGAWNRLESQPMGTNDDHHNDDECLNPTNNRIFVVDTPGFSNTNFPHAAGIRFVALNGGTTDPAATDVVLRLSFAEWVIARSRSEGIDWKTISPGPFTFWHSITWLTRNAAGQWVVDAGRSEIEQGSLAASAINAEPTP